MNRHTFQRRGWALAVAAAAGLITCGTAAVADETPAVAAKSGASAVAGGRELFTREWLPGDKRSHDGDGLGPMFNDSSCVACHNQGGIRCLGFKRARFFSDYSGVFGPGRRNGYHIEFNPYRGKRFCCSGSCPRHCQSNRNGAKSGH